MQELTDPGNEAQRQRRRTADIVCPRCGGEAMRVKRRPLDHFISRFVKVRRFQCRKCRWSGLRRAPRDR